MSRYVHPEEQLVVELLVRDLQRSLAFYRALGFDVLQADEKFAVLAWEGHRLFLDQQEGLPDPRPRPTMNVRVMVPDVDQHWRRAGEVGACVVAPIGDRPYGLRDFTIADPDGFGVRFATRLEAVGPRG
jgi:catechol 2,3-dioxygenase-like lactoylglutathione lyase family enzyme